MTVMVDQEPLAAEQLGLSTVGQVLSHLSSRNRLVVHLMIDGRSPDMGSIETVRSQPLTGRTVYIETTEPKQIVTDVCREADQLLDEAEAMRSQAIDLLQTGKPADAFRRLSVCFNNWNHTRESVQKVGRLLRADLKRLFVGDESLQAWLESFTVQLAQMRQAIESRDFIHLSDVLAYEAHETTGRWRSALNQLRALVS
jgi:hypothetical protein